MACGCHGRSSFDKREEIEQGGEQASVITTVKHPHLIQEVFGHTFFPRQAGVKMKEEKREGIKQERGKTWNTQTVQRNLLL